ARAMTGNASEASSSKARRVSPLPFRQTDIWRATAIVGNASADFSDKALLVCSWLSRPTVTSTTPVTSGAVLTDFKSETRCVCPELDPSRQSGRCRVRIRALPPEFLQPVEKAPPPVLNPVAFHGDFLVELQPN